MKILTLQVFKFLMSKLVASTTALENENSDEPSMNLDPVNAAELVSTPKTQKPTKPAHSPLSELLVYPTPKQKKAEVKKYAAHVLTSTESIALLEEKSKRKLEK